MRDTALQAEPAGNDSSTSQHALSKAMPHSPGHALTALREIARSLSTAWDLDSTLDLIVRQTTKVMNCDSCSIYLLDPDGETLRLRATTGLARQALGQATLRTGEGMTGYAVAQRRPIHDADAQVNPHFKWVHGAAEQVFRSLLAVPLLLNERALGAMNVQTFAVHEFSPPEVETLLLIADLAGGALAKAQLHDTQRRQIAELQALADVSQAVTSPLYLDDMLDVVTAMAARTVKAAVCSIYLLDESGTHLHLRSAQRETVAYRHREPVPIGQGVIGQVALTGKLVYVPDVRSSPDYVHRELAREEGLVSLLSVPLSVGNRVIGVLNTYTATDHTFPPEQQALLRALANQTALALENARLATNAAIMREMHHRIKNNLQTVAMLMRLQLGDTESQNARQVLETSIHRVHSIAAVHEVLSERGFSMVDLKEVLSRLVQLVGGTLTSPGKPVLINVKGESLSLPSRSATNLALIVNELMQNALEHAFPDMKEGSIDITLATAPEALIVSVRDNGQGLRAQSKPGLGTEIIRTLVEEELKGRLVYETGAGGTMATIYLPRELAAVNA